MAGKDLYDTLGVTRSATPDEVRDAYRKLARKAHPDVNPGDQAAEERFKQLSHAFDVLSDPDRRKLYDEFGEAALAAGFDPEQARAYRQWRDRRHAGGNGAFGDPFGDTEFDLRELFGFGFGGSTYAGTTEKRQRGPVRGADLRAALDIGFAEAVLGTEQSLTLQRPRSCPSCGGSGRRAGAGPVRCQACDGRGSVDISRGPMRVHTSCADCGGSGQTPGPPCPNCNGAGTVTRDVRLKVTVPPGIDDADTIRLAGQGMPGRDGGKPGDLLIKIGVRPHPHLRRHGRDLELTVPVTIREALLGEQVEVPTLQGKIKLRIPNGAQNGQRLRVKGRGVPGGKAQGDLYVKLDIRMPDPAADPQAAARAADELQRLYASDIRASLRI